MRAGLIDITRIASAISHAGVELTLCGSALKDLRESDLLDGLQIVLELEHPFAFDQTPKMIGTLMGPPLVSICTSILDLGGVPKLAQNLGIPIVEAKVDGRIARTLPIDSLIPRR